MMDLAIHSELGPVTLADISQCQDISLSYLEQLFAKLRRAELVEGAMRSALDGDSPDEESAPPAASAPAGNLIESLNPGATGAASGGVKIVMLDKENESDS